MNTEEKYHGKAEDALTRCIVDRLGERAQKMQRMATWERRRKVQHQKRVFAVSSVAAVLLLVFLVIPPRHSENDLIEQLQLTEPAFENFRAASDFDQTLTHYMEVNDYESALSVCEEQLLQSNQDVAQLQETSQDSLSEEKIYETELARLKNEQLLWTHIYLLVHNKKFETAKKEIERYLRVYPNGDYCKEAEKVLKVLQQENL